jgi:hypothetical protein
MRQDWTRKIGTERNEHKNDREAYKIWMKVNRNTKMVLKQTVYCVTHV